MLNINYEKISNYFYKQYKCIQRNKKFGIFPATLSEKKFIIDTILTHLDNFKIMQYCTRETLLLKFENKYVLFYVLYKKEHNNKKLIQTCKELLQICTFFYFYAKCKEKINLIWIPIPIKKDYQNDIDKSAENFQAFSVSGITFSHFTSENKLCSIITRKEEIHRLCIHELLHQTKLDFSNCTNIDIKNQYRKLKNACNYHYHHSLIESFTELSSTYYNIMFQLYFVYKKSLNEKIFQQKFIFCINIEILYSTIVVLSIIKINNYINLKDFNEKKCFYGDISIYEYYYIKWLLLFLFDYTNQNNIYERIHKIHEIPATLLNKLEFIYKKIKILKNYTYVFCTREKIKKIFY